jgi:hypothetical protein
MILADSPVAYFRLGESSGTVAVDQSGHNNDGVLLPGTILRVPGAIAGDSDTAISIGDGGVSAPESLDFSGTAPFSVEAWAKYSATSQYNALFSKDTRTTDREHFGAFVDPQWGLAFQRWVKGENVSVFAPLPSVGEYHHIVCTYDGSTMALYVDANLAGSAEDRRSQQPKSVPFYVGNGWVSSWIGAIDEFAVYARPLTQSDIARHYAKGRGL